MEDFFHLADCFMADLINLVVRSYFWFSGGILMINDCSSLAGFSDRLLSILDRVNEHDADPGTDNQANEKNHNLSVWSSSVRKISLIKRYETNERLLGAGL